MRSLRDPLPPEFWIRCDRCSLCGGQLCKAFRARRRLGRVTRWSLTTPRSWLSTACRSCCAVSRGRWAS